MWLYGKRRKKKVTETKRWIVFLLQVQPVQSTTWLTVITPASAQHMGEDASHLQQHTLSPALHPGPAKANYHGNGQLNGVRVSWKLEAFFSDRLTSTVTRRKRGNWIYSAEDVVVKAKQRPIFVQDEHKRSQILPSSSKEGTPTQTQNVPSRLLKNCKPWEKKFKAAVCVFHQLLLTLYFFESLLVYSDSSCVCDWAPSPRCHAELRGDKLLSWVTHAS